jgi:hypothetical protein
MAMSGWTADQLRRVGAAEELQVASYGGDGTLRSYVTIWVVRAGDDIYIRTAHGTQNPWFRRAKAGRTGRIRAGGVERDVAFEDVPAEVHQAVDSAYHAKYDRYGATIVGAVVGAGVREGTFRLQPHG